MNDRPTAVELLEAAARFLREEAVAGLRGTARYQARVAANVVSMVARELETEEAHLTAEWQRLGRLLSDDAAVPASRVDLRSGVRERTERLVERIRAGDADRGDWRVAVLDHLSRTVGDKLAVARPAAR